MLHYPILLAGLLGLSPFAATLNSQGGTTQSEGVRAIEADSLPQSAPMRLGIELAALAPGVQLSFEELDDLLLRRIAMTPNGRGALRELIDLAVIDHLAQERKVVISQAQMNGRWAQIEQEVVQSGQASSMAEFLELSGVDRDTFRRYLELALIQETLTRDALGLGAKEPINAEQQKLWIESEIETLGYGENEPYWEDGIVATVGPLAIQRGPYAAHLRSQTDPKEIKQACYEALLLKKIRLKFPALSPDAKAKVIAAEIEIRRMQSDMDPRTKGVAFENILATQGLTLETFAMDPAVVSAALARLWVDSTCDDDCLRGAYEAERDQYDGMFGEGAEVFAIKINAGKVKNELIPNTFEEAEALLENMRPDLKDLDSFKRIAAVRSDDIRSRKSGGLLGWVRMRTAGVDPAIRGAVIDFLTANEGPIAGKLVGPIRLNGSVMLLCLGQRTVAPTWEVMSQNVHRELRRRFMLEQLPTSQLNTYLDKSPQRSPQETGPQGK